MVLISIESMQDTIESLKQTPSTIDRYRRFMDKFEEHLTKLQASFTQEELDLESAKHLCLIASLVKKNPSISQEMLNKVCKMYNSNFETIEITRFTHNLYAQHRMLQEFQPDQPIESEYWISKKLDKSPLVFDRLLKSLHISYDWVTKDATVARTYAKN